MKERLFWAPLLVRWVVEDGLMKSIEEWERYKKYLSFNPEIGLMVDISRMKFPENYFDQMEPKIQRAYEDMNTLESGAIANPDEKRMGGHYWLRAPDLAPNLEISLNIKNTFRSIKDFARDVHQGKIVASNSKPFSCFLLIG